MLDAVGARFEMVRELVGTGNTKSAASNGYYEKVPFRVNEFVLDKNEQGKVVFETTEREICEDGPKMVVRIIEDDGDWRVNVQHGPYHWSVTNSVSPLEETVSRKRAFWHAAQHMVQRELSHAERFTLSRRVQLNMSDVSREDIIAEVESEEPDLDSLGSDDRSWTLQDVYEDDAFFTENGVPVTDPPFKEFLEETSD